MNRIGRRLFQAQEILKAYEGNVPLIVFLKDHFKKNKKFGKRDRSEITEICFSYYRMGTLTKTVPFEQCASIGYLLSNNIDLEEVHQLNEENGWQLPETFTSIDFQEKVEQLELALNISIKNNVTGKNYTLSTGIDMLAFEKHLFQQAPVFIRILRNKPAIIAEFTEALIPFMELDKNCLQLKWDVKLNALDSFNRGYFYIQDHASQQTLNNIAPKEGETWWDACCGAGGKTLLFKHQFPEAELVATDLRNSIIKNFNARLQHHQLNSKARVFNLEQPASGSMNQYFDGIVLDVPCSGSGTWRRSPENIASFTQEKLQQYAKQQRRLLKNACAFLNKKGTIQYITCSVFKSENEHIIEYAVKELGLELMQQGIINSQQFSSDYLFAATLIKKQ